jgi:hypothetical protein
MFQQAFFAPLSERNSEKTFFSIFTTFHIRGGSRLDIWCLLGLSGEGSPPKSPPAREPASTASRPRFIATRACSCSRSPSRSDIFLISTSIWWDPYSTVVVAISFSLSLIAHPNGWKQFRCLLRLRQHALKLKFSLGFSDFECPKRSLPMVGRNLLQIFGPSLDKQQHIILSQTVQSKDCIVISRMRYAHAPPQRLGLKSYLLYSSASMHSQGKTLVFPRFRQFLVL